MEAVALTTEAKLKLALMRAIDSDLKRRFRTMAEAAEFVGEDQMRLYRMGSGHHEFFSFKWLFRVAAAGNVHIRISVDPVNRR